jgi:large repetitive protein
MNMDGIDDVGLWVPARDGVPPTEGAEWYFLISGVVENDTPPGVPALHGPSITGGQYAAGDGPGAHLGFATYGLVADAYTNGRIVDDPLIAGPGNIVRFNPTPFGNDQYLQFGDKFALPLVGNFDPPVNPAVPSGGNTNLNNPVDVNNDGYVSPLDALIVINYMNANGPGTAAPTSGFSAGPYVDVNGDGSITPLDALIVINYLNALYLASQGEGEAEDAFFEDFGNQEDDGDDDLLTALAADTANS